VTRSKTLIGAAVVLALALAACGGSPGSAGPTGSPSSSSPTSPSGTTTTLSGSVLACHRRPNLTTVVILLFSSSDPEVVAAGPNLTLDVAPVDPSTWSNGEPIELTRGANWGPRRWRTTIPVGVVTPPTFTFQISAAATAAPSVPLASGRVVVSVPTGACSSG
jgi:hypothetical protein